MPRWKPFETTAAESLRALGVGSAFASLDTGGLSANIPGFLGCEWVCVGSGQYIQHVVRFDLADAPDVINIDRNRIIEIDGAFARTPTTPSSGHHMRQPPARLAKLITEVSGRQAS